MSHRSYRVPHETLDSLFYRQRRIRSCPSFVKMDLENHEILALLGSRRMLRECQPILLVESGCRQNLRSKSAYGPFISDFFIFG